MFAFKISLVVFYPPSSSQLNRKRKETEQSQKKMRCKILTRQTSRKIVVPGERNTQEKSRREKKGLDGDY